MFAARVRGWATSPLAREEPPARAYYAALFHAAWVDGLDVNEPAVVGRVAVAAGLDVERLLSAAMERGPGEMLEQAIHAFDRDECSGVPAPVVDDDAFCKDRVDWLVDHVRDRIGVVA